MKLEQQVVSLELARKLKELGVKQESAFWWNERYLLDNPDQKSIDVRFMMNPDLNGTAYSYHHEKDLYAAFTVAELGEMLPDEIEVDEVSSWFNTTRGFGSSWVVGYRENGTNYNRYAEEASTEAEARGLMLAYLIENSLITV